MMLMLPVLFPALFLGLQYTPSLNRRLPCVRMSASDIDGAVQVSKLPTAAQLCSAADEEVADLTDLVWTAIRGQAAAASSSPVLAPFFQTTISSQSTLPKALAGVLARKIASDAADFADASPLPDAEALYKNVWAEINPNGRLFFDGRPEQEEAS